MIIARCVIGIDACRFYNSLNCCIGKILLCVVSVISKSLKFPDTVEITRCLTLKPIEE